MGQLLTYLLVFGVSAAVALILAPLAGRLGHRLGIVDRPGGRRAHEGEVSRLGGVALFMAFSVASLPVESRKTLSRPAGLICTSFFASRALNS